MRIEFTTNGWSDFTYWLDHDMQLADRIRDLITDIRRDPFKGLGKPEPLRHQMAGFWSRRINSEHRLVYAVKGERGDRSVTILSCRYHYDQ
jgi:toxin YoeB